MNQKTTYPQPPEGELLFSPFHMDFTAPHLRVVDALLRSSPHIVFVQDPGGRFVYVGPAAACSFGLPVESMLDKTSAELGLASEAVQELDRQREQVFVTGLSVNREMALPTVSGLRDFEVTLSPVQDAKGEMQAVLCMARDITESKILARERDDLLRQATQKSAELTAVIANIPDAVCIGNEYGVTVCNEPLLRMFGFESLEDMNQKMACVAERVQARSTETGELIPPWEAPFPQALQGKTVVQELQIRNVQSGEDLILRCTAAPVLSDGKVIAAVAVNTDITEQKLHEAQLADLNKRLKRGVQETHHRVKNNLQLISSLLDMAVMEHEEALPLADVKRLAMQIRTLAGIHDVLTNDAQYSQDADSSTLSVQVMLSRLVTMLRSTADRHRIEQEIEDLQISLQKATALALITNELISNAIKYGGGWVRVRFLVGSEAARLIIEDDGPGFEAGFTLESAAQNGLMLVDNLTRHDLRATLVFENRMEGGARVVVTLPLKG